MDCPECGATIPPDADLCPDCTAEQIRSQGDEASKIIAGMIGLFAGTLLSLLMLPIGGDVVFFYTVWILPALLCVLGYQIGGIEG